METNKYKYAFLKSLPVMFGYVFLGIAFGIVAAQAGYHVLWAFFMSVIVFAGSMQFVMVPLMAAAVSPFAMALTALFVNFRHIFYGFSFVESFRKMKQKYYMVFSLSDETYSVLLSCKSEDPEEKMRDAWFLIALFDQCYWVIGSVIGAILGQALPFDFTGIDFSMTALFVVILVEQILGDPKAARPAAAAGLVISGACVFFFGTENFLIPALLLVVLFVVVFSRRAGSPSDAEQKGGSL